MRRLILLAGMFCAAPLAARDIYLSPTGDDGSGDGSQAAPFRTLAHVLDPANERVAAGDRLILRAPAGNRVYAETEVRLRLPLTLMAAPGESPHIQCPLDVEDSVCVQIDPEASGSVISGLEISGGNLYGVFLQTAWEQQAAPTASGARDVLLEDCRIHDSGRDAVKVTPKSDNLTIRRCEIYNTGRIYPPGTPLEERNAEGIDNVNGSGMRVQDSYIHDTSTNGIYFKGGAADVVIERNRIERTGESGILAGYDTSPEFFDLSLNPQYYEAIRGSVRNNIVRDTDYAGIGLYASRDTLVAHNTLIDTARLGHAALYFGVTLQDFDPQAGRPANTAARVLNNLISQGAGQGDCMRIRFANELGGLSGLAGASGLDFNLYSRPGGCRFFDQREGSGLEEGGGLAQWQSAAAADLHSLEAPVGLTDDGHLAAGSAAIDRATTLPAVSDDIDRQPRSTPYDIGADEASGSVPSGEAIPIAGALSGSWFDPARNGEGFLLEVGTGASGRILVVSWYTYRSGAPLWLVGSVELQAGARAAEVALFEGRGAQFGAAFDPADVVLSPWGRASFRFESCTLLQVDYASAGGESGRLRLQRILSGVDGLPCR